MNAPDSPLSTYAHLLAEALIQEITPSVDLEQEPLVQMPLDNGGIILVGFTPEVARQLLTALDLVCDA